VKYRLIHNIQFCLTSPYLVITDQEYTKHYYAGTQRIASKIGAGFDGALVDMDVNVATLNSDVESIANGLINLLEESNTCAQIESGNVTMPEPNLPIVEELRYTSINNLESDMYFYHSDHLGSSSWITDASGAVNQHLQYLAFGEDFIYQRNSSWNVPYTFSGKEKDSETGYSYFGARYYDGDLSVWLSVDPLASRFPGISGYSYAFWNPVMFVDDDGLWPKFFKVKMDDGSNVWTIAHTDDGQKFWFFSWKDGFKSFNYRSTFKERKSLALLRGRRSQQFSDYQGDIQKMEESFGDNKVTKILTKLTEQHDNVKLHVIGNHYVSHEMYYAPYQTNEIGRCKENSKVISLYTHDDIVYVTASGVPATYENRTFDIDSEWSKSRAQFIVDTYFDGSKTIDVQSRYNVNNSIINGVRLDQFGHDEVGITIGISISKRKKETIPDRHKTVLFL